MLLFSRMATPTVSPKKAMPFVHKVTAYVNEHSDLELSCWLATLGVPVGTVAWSTVAESQAALAAANAGLMSDPGYLDVLEEGEALGNTPAVDSLRNHIYGDRKASAVGSVLQMTSGVAETARLADAIGWAVDMASYVESVINSPVVVTNSVTGTLGELSFISVQDGYEQVDSARNALQADTGYLERIAKSDGLFVSGSGHVVQAMRII